MAFTKKWSTRLKRGRRRWVAVTRGMGGEPAPAGQARGDRVLVVDDEQDVRESIGSLLTLGLGVQAIITASAADAMGILARQHVDVLIVDYRMPETNGLDFLIAARERAPGARRILITAFPEMEVAIRAVNEGRVDGFFVKPFDADELLALVRDLLGKKREEARAGAELARSFRRPGRPSKGAGEMGEASA